MTEKTFGTAQADISYTEWRGAYLIAIESGKLHTVRKNGGIYLLGGKAAEDVSHEDVILQACMDTTGFDASVEDFVTDADLYDSDGKEHSIRTYYSGTFFEQIAPPKDTSCTHGQLSLTDIDRLTLPIERWAVAQCIEMLRADAHGSDDEEL